MCSLSLLGAAGLSACSGSSNAANSADPSASAIQASAGADGSTASASAAAVPGVSGPASASNAILTKLSAVPVGGSVSLTVDGKPVIVSQPTAGTAAAFSAICPHQGATVAVAGTILKCPLHGSTFAEATGANISGPAAGRPLTPLNVKVSGGNIVLSS